MSSVQLRGLAEGELVDTSGNALNGIPVWIYARGTVDQVAVFADSGMTVPIAQPLVTGTNTAPGALPGYVRSPQSIDIVNGNTGDLIQAEVVSGSDLIGLGLSVGGAWSSSTIYQSGEIVTYTGFPYVSLVGGNQNNEPDISSGQWMQLISLSSGLIVEGAWSAGTLYGPGAIVTYGGYPYASSITTQGDQPDVSPTQWVRLLTPPITQQALGNMGAAKTIDFGSIQDNYIEITGTLNANCTITLANRAAGCKLLLLLTQDGTGSRTLTISDGSTSAVVQVPTQPSATFSIDVECPNATDIYALPASSGPLPSSVVTLTALGSLVIGSVQLATTATDGFVYLPSCAGTPTGVPTTHTGSNAVVYDTSGHKLWVYDAGWKGVALA